jgi:hypothetical protein
MERAGSLLFTIVRFATGVPFSVHTFIYCFFKNSVHALIPQFFKTNFNIIFPQKNNILPVAI